MTKLLAVFVALAAMAGLGAVALSSQPALRWQIAQLTGVSQLWGSPVCTVSTADGATVTMNPKRTRDVLDAAVDGTGRSRVRTVDGVVVDSVALNPTAPAQISCLVRPGNDLAAQDLQDNGLTARANRMRGAVRSRFGDIPDGGFAPGGVSTGHGAVSAHYAGLAVDFFFRPYEDPAQRARGWTVANWLAANAEPLNIAVLIYDDKIWSARRAIEGWRQYSHPDGRTDPINRHLDHIHVDVIAGD